MQVRWAALVLLIAVAAPAQAEALDVPGLPDLPDPVVVDPDRTPSIVSDLVGDGEPEDPAEPAPPSDGSDPGFADRVRQALADEAVAFSAASLLAVLVTAGGFALVTRYISPKEALKNPQRAMLYGFVRATPGAHLKQLSEEFGMKTSSILWHIRKLESADLVRSERVNGYRVFYPCEGGVEVRRVSRAMAALQNDNALRIYQHLHRRPGVTARHLSEHLGIHSGTARWHLRKLREHGLLDELIQEDASRFYPTPLGNRALEAREGRAVDMPSPRRAPVPSE